MSKFNFKNLIRKYSKQPAYTVVEIDGYSDYDNGGIWVEGDTEDILIVDAAVVPLSEKELKFGEGGTFTTEDRKLYCYEEIEPGSLIKHKEKTYTTFGDKDYADFDDGLHIYILKRGDRID